MMQIISNTIVQKCFFLVLIWASYSCNTPKQIIPNKNEELLEKQIEKEVKVESIVEENYDVSQHYTKQEIYISMRDGTKLFTALYIPTDISPINRYPLLMKRTCYSVKPYGPNNYPKIVGPTTAAMKEKFIFVYQDVRGRWMSEGDFTNMTPIVEHISSNDTDESTDTYDTVEWLIQNVKYHNGRIGQWGISYPGFYATNAAIDAHPAMKAISPQAPIGDFFFDDFHHNGAYTLGYYYVNNLFGKQKTEPVDTAWYQFPKIPTPDLYDFYLKHTPLSKLDKTFPDENFFWEEIKEHPNYDAFWKKRGIIQHLKNDIRPAMMIVGGWYDAEDLYGPLMTYKTIEKYNPNTYNTIVMGPWSHGDWSRNTNRQAVSNVFFGEGINEEFQKNVELTFFKHFLKGSGDGNTGLPEAYMFDSGLKSWTEFDAWPPKESKKKELYFHENWTLSEPIGDGHGVTSFVSDPHKPVPFRMDIKPIFIPRKYMADDQRQQNRRPDVLVFETEVLEENLTLAGPVNADLFVSTTGTAMDWVVKLIDVYPTTAQNTIETQNTIDMAGYQQLVRGEVFRGRFRESFEHPKAFVPNVVENISWDLQDVHHTFKKGHKLMIQLHSSWFPYVDVNPQTYVDNIFEAKEKDFQKQTHSFYHNKAFPSKVTLTVIQ